MLHQKSPLTLCRYGCGQWPYRLHKRRKQVTVIADSRLTTSMFHVMQFRLGPITFITLLLVCER